MDAGTITTALLDLQRGSIPSRLNKEATMFKLTPNCLRSKSELELRALFREATSRALKSGRLTAEFNEAQTAITLIRTEFGLRGLSI